MDINQVYKAPSIPKLSKKNISSSVLRGATATTATPKLKTTRFSFVKPKINTETLKTDISSAQISESLVETNRILVEIQKQLAYDFANRIAEEKEAIKKIKAAESKRKFVSKEASVEATKKITSSLGGAIGKVTAPIKSVFDKIKEFFTLILTGIVLNAAFKWLQDENNRKLLDGVFYWIGKAFVPVLIGVLSYKVFKWIRRLYKIGKFLWKLPGRMFKIFNRITSPTNQWSPKTTGGGSRSSPIKPAISVRGSALERAKGTAPVGPEPGQAPGIKPIDAVKNLKKVPKTPAWMVKVAPVVNTAGRILRAVGAGLLFLEVKSDLENGDIKAAVVKLSAFGLGWLAAWIIGGSGLIATPASGGASLALLAGAAGAQVGTEYGIRKVFGYKDGGTIRASNGMTVPGKGSGLVDSVKAMLAPGEEVIRTASAMLFRPLLKDINDNAGRLWVIFSQAIRKLISVSEYQKQVSNEFSKVIEDFDKYLKDDIAKKRGIKPGGGGIGGNFKMSSSQKSSISAAPKVINVSMNVSGSGMTFLPMVLPTQKSKPPQIPQMQSKSNDVPAISPVDFSNPWMDISPEWYGIQLYG